MKRTFVKASLALACMSGLSISYATANTINPPKNVIGFFQSYDGLNAWYFNTAATPLTKTSTAPGSGYTILIDAFWVNYPYCWGSASGQHSPIPECKGIYNAPGPGLTYKIDTSFWQNNTAITNPSSQPSPYEGGAAPSQPGDAYDAYWTSLHTTGPQMMYGLRANIAKNAPNIKLLASIGGWNMGGSSSGKPNTPTPPQTPAWAALLKNPQNLADAMSAIVGIKAQLPQPPESTGKVVSLYDGIDIDMETLYAAGCTGDTNTCSLADEQKTITNTAAAIAIFRKAHPNTILSISPRAADIYCEASSCSWHDSTGYGFIGKILKKLADQHVYFNYINPQFYNDNGARNVPNNTSSLSNPQPTYSSPSIGTQVATILSKLQGIVGSNSEINIGVLAQTDDHWIDSGGSFMPNNPGVPKSQVKNLWDLLQTDPDIKASGATISGLMTWAANLSFSVGLPGHVRSKTSTNNVPYNWGNISTAQPLHPQSAVVHKQSLWSKLISKVEGLF